MKKAICIFFSCILACTCVQAQQLYFPQAAIKDSSFLLKTMPVLAKQVMVEYKEQDPVIFQNNLFRLQAVAGEYEDAVKTINSLRSIARRDNTPFAGLQYLQYELFCQAKIKARQEQSSYAQSFEQVLNDAFSRMDDKTALYGSNAFISLNGFEEQRAKLQALLVNQQGKDSIDFLVALDLCKKYLVTEVFKQGASLTGSLIQADNKKRYIIDDNVLIKTPDGATIAAIVVRKRSVNIPQPVALVFTIYAEENNLYQAKTAAAYGYAGIVALSRGKGLSPDKIAPYEHEVTDVNAVIDWASRQSWSNGKVGMYGGSYDGFSQWAATKQLHPALKTIVPYVAAIPGLGLPMENNVFLNANYGWAFYVGNNKYLDNKVYNDPQRWENMDNNWYASGAAYRKIDSVDGTPNKWLQRWLQHPAYDRYWQGMVPYQQDFSRINIPVLTITGYYDDGQISAIQYLKEHYRYNKNADHYLIIGPYDHVGAQHGGTAVLRDYKVDPVALINTRDITFEWLDHILKNGKRPAIIQDKINYEIMGANRWGHAPSLEKMNTAFLQLYLCDTKQGGHYLLADKKPGKKGFLNQEVDFADRKTSNNDYYPYPIIRKELDLSNGLSFLSEPLSESLIVDGTFSGMLKASINKKDMDIGVVLYEVMPDGQYFHLSYYLGRASYSRDMSVRKLLKPGSIEEIPFERTRMVSRQLSKGSRLLVVLNINKNAFAQLNYGTGKEVSDETIGDAKIPLQIKWYNDSYIRIPVSK